MREFFRRLISPAGDAAPNAASGQASPAKPITPRVLMIVHNPPVPSEGGRRLTELFGWNDPMRLSTGYIADLERASGGYLRYQIAERIDAD